MPFNTTHIVSAVVLSSLTLVGVRLSHDLYYRSRTNAFTYLNSIRGISDINVLGSHDITYDVHCVSFQISGRPDAVIVIEEPGLDVVGAPEHIRLRRFGPWEFHQVSYKQQGSTDIQNNIISKMYSYRSSVDVGKCSILKDLLPISIRDINDLVLNYDVLTQSFAAWPDEKRWGLMEGSSGTRLAFCRMTMPRKGPVPPPPQFSGAW